jgi:hypothetical protein
MIAFSLRSTLQVIICVTLCCYVTFCNMTEKKKNGGLEKEKNLSELSQWQMMDVDLEFTC